ncbi:MAG TPA: hypothetical protein VLS27_11665 [Gammaproteobacteria bacterium]|nr:hypothetical protein [Gammaproteobacteria bacterium]
MSDATILTQKVGMLSGKLVELGQFGQRGTELQYSFVRLAEENGDITTLHRMAVPAELNKLLEIDKSVDLFLTKRGLWHYCYGIRIDGNSAQSYRGYRLFYIFNRLMMYVNIIFGVYLLMTPGIVWAGAGLLIFGLLFAFLGPASPRRMQAFFLSHVNAEAAGSGQREETSSR